MSAYAIVHLRDVILHPDVFEYMERIQETLYPFSGRLIVHGGELAAVEGSWPGAAIVIEFSSMTEARAWYPVASLPRDPSPSHRAHRSDRHHCGRCRASARRTDAARSTYLEMGHTHTIAGRRRRQAEALAGLGVHTVMARSTRPEPAQWLEEVWAPVIPRLSAIEAVT